MSSYFRYVATFVAAFALTAISLAQQTASSNAEAALLQMTPAQMREDLLFLREQWAKQDKSFNPEQAKQFDVIVTDAIGHADSLDSVAFWMQVSRAAALSRNGHTNVNADIPPFPGLPFKAWWFKDGLYNPGSGGSVLQSARSAHRQDRAHHHGAGAGGGCAFHLRQ